MLTRLTHAAIAFAVTVVVYQAYVLVVAPFVEPSLASSEPPAAPPQQGAETRQVVHKYRELLAAYFPPGHWTLTQPPKTFDIGDTMIVLDDYRPKDNGELRVNQCVILFFPRERIRGEPPPRDAIVLEAPHGAVLQMDESFRPGLGGLGRIQWGKLVGEISIRSDMREPGPEDDLFLKTRDLYMNEDLIRTDAKVEMRLGPHRGRGRVLEIRLVAVERARSHSSGPQVGGIDSLEILHDVEAQITPGKVQGFGNGGPTAVPIDNTPVDVTCQGSFRFDFTHQVASFSKQVKLAQLHSNGQLDQLESDELNLYFEPRSEEVANTAARAKPQAFAGIRLGLIEALGSSESPVVLDAPSQQAAARCRRMRVELGPQRITLDRGDEVTLTFQGSEIHARQLQYQAPPQGSSQRIGTLLAAGHGWLRAIPSDKRPQDPFEVRWTEKMRLERVEGKPVLTLHGRPRLEMVGMGQLWADDMTLYLRERALDGSETDWLPGDVVPQRMVARGRVAIDSGELSGKVDQLEVNVEYVPNRLTLGRPDGKDPRTGLPTIGRRAGNRSRAYHIVGKKLQVLLTVHEQQPEITSIDVDGGVVFRESTPSDAGGQPLVVQGNHLRVENADTPSAEFSLKGQPATITAAGMSIRAAELRMHRDSSRAWVDSPGELQLPMARDLNGDLLAGPQFLVIRWQGGMELDQDLVTFHGNVVANTNDGSLKTERLLVQLSSAVRFDGAAQQQQQVQLAQIECRQGAIAEFKQRDQTGLVSVQLMELESFVANQLSGEIRGRGPGWLESVHLSSGTSPIGALAGTGGAASRRSSQRLRFLRIEFKRGVQGNLHQRRLEVTGDTRAIYGPVDSWQQRLEMSVRGNPGPDTIWITSEKLGVAENPAGRRNRDSGLGPIDLYAEGNVTIEGRAGERGLFTTRSHIAKYDQQKTIFILEGDHRRPATIYHQQYPGAPRSETSARKLMYLQATGEVRGEGFVGGQFKQIDAGSRSPANR